MTNNDAALAEQICALLNGEPTHSSRLVVDISETALRAAADRVNVARAGVEPRTALAVIQALLVMGWRPAPREADNRG